MSKLTISDLSKLRDELSNDLSGGLTLTAQERSDWQHAITWIDGELKQCHCESSLCECHGQCDRTDIRSAPVRGLEGEPMCKRCIAHYLASGYGITPVRG